MTYDEQRLCSVESPKEKLEVAFVAVFRTVMVTEILYWLRRHAFFTY